jgi:PAS domain S-box-containing protein
MAICRRRSDERMLHAVEISVTNGAEEAARQSADRFRFMAESMPQKIFTAKPNGDVDYLNQQWTELTGLPVDEIDGWDWTRFIHPDDVEENIRVWERSLDTGEPLQLEHRFRGADGVYHWHLSRAQAVRGASGEITMWIGSSTDIDNVKRTEQALHEANRKKDEFLAMLGHELRNPLAPILTALELMKLRGLATGAERERDVIERQVRHVARLVDDLLDVSKITRGKISLQREPLEIFVAIAKAIEIAAPIIEQRTHLLCVDVPAAGLAVDGDPVRLSQVIANLLTNAALYTPHGGRIDISARREGRDVVFDVTDTGIGIDAQLLPQVFDMFIQGARPIDRAEGGLGLGLGLVHSLVELHGGSVTADSGGPGKGSRFTVRLPALEMTPSVVLALSGPPVATQPVLLTNVRRVLLVDDNADAAEILGELLRTLGHEVAIAYDGPQALIALESFDAEVAVLDIGLPVMDGYELASRIRADFRRRSPRLVAVTGYGQPDDLTRSRKAGFDEHLVKPVGINSLIEAIEGPDCSGPVESAPVLTIAATMKQGDDGKRGAAPRIVLVERDRYVCDLVALFLERVGFEVERAETGYIGLDRVRRLGRAIVITEILLPELDGLRLCRLIKGDMALRAGVVVLSTLSAAERAREAGADAFLMKPIDEERLISTVNEVAAKLSSESRSTT